MFSVGGIINPIAGFAIFNKVKALESRQFLPYRTVIESRSPLDLADMEFGYSSEKEEPEYLRARARG